MTNKIGIINISENLKTKDIFKDLGNSNLFDKIMITNNPFQIDKCISKNILISEDLNLYENVIQNLFNTYEKIIIVAVLGGEFTTKFFKYFAEKISNATCIFAQPLKIAASRLLQKSNQTIKILNKNNNKIILITNEISLTEFEINSEEINAKCDFNFFEKNVFLGSGSNLEELYDLLGKILVNKILNQVENFILENNSHLNDEEFSFCEKLLKNLLKENEKLNKNTEKLAKKSNAFNYDDNDLKNEIWKEYPTNKLFYVSNLGRVKYDGKIMPQVEEKGKVGYLILKKNLEKNISSDYVYNFVARTFLGKIEGDGFHVHHITNDGYDNSVNNLILLTQKQHSEVHGFEVGYNKSK